MHERKDSVFRGDLGPTVPVEVKEVAESGEFEGYGAIFGNVDQGLDVVQVGAFKDSLSRIPAGKVRMLYHHDPREVIGKWTEMREDQKGLYCKGKFNLDVQKAREVHSNMMNDSIEGLSIGYRVQEYEINNDEGVRTIEKAELREVSVVTFPMNELAGVSLVKHDGTLPTEREVEGLLRDAGFSRSQAKAFIADGYKSLKGARDAAGGDEGALEAIQRLTKTLRG